VPLDPAVLTVINRYRGLAVTTGTEKAKSEFIFAPLLGEVWHIGADRLALFSGVTLTLTRPPN
jgi:hypothetical protein